MWRVGAPTSVRTPSRAAPSVTTSCTGSRASCGTGNGCISRSLIANAAWLSMIVASDASAASARAVPWVIQARTPWRRANGSAPSAWSPCSWVTKMPARSPGARPRRVSRRSVSSVENPQSTRMRVEPASTTRPFPSLPLPSDAKRTAVTRSAVRAPSPASLQLIVEEREDLLRRTGRVGLAVLAEHLDLGVVGDALDDHLILHRLRRLVGPPERELVEPPVLLVVGRRIDVAHEVDALRPVAVLDGEADAVERQADAAPGAVERLGHLPGGG